MTRREQELDDRRTQTAALVTALNAVVKVMERLEPKSVKNEREKEGVCSIATSNDVFLIPNAQVNCHLGEGGKSAVPPWRSTTQTPILSICDVNATA